MNNCEADYCTFSKITLPLSDFFVKESVMGNKATNHLKIKRLTFE